MAKKDRTGERKYRDRKEFRRIPSLGYYLIVTDTEETETLYFNGLKESLDSEVRKKLVIKVVDKVRTKELVSKCKENAALLPQYCTPWIVFDRDQVENFNEIIEEAQKSDIHVGWSNPCFEIWMYAYFGSMPAIRESWTCCSRFGEIYEKRTGQKYSKADEDMYRRLIENGDEESAMAIAQLKYEQCIKNGYTNPSEMYPCTMVYELVGEIKKRAEK